jgi:hypothetical protein
MAKVYNSVMGKPCDTVGQQELLDAIKQDNLEKVIELSETVDIRFDSDRPFYNAVYYGCFQIVKWLVSKGVDINCNDAYGVRAGAFHKNFDEVEWYINNGADIHCRGGQADHSALDNAKNVDVTKNIHEPSLYCFMLKLERKRKLKLLEHN